MMLYEGVLKVSKKRCCCENLWKTGKGGCWGGAILYPGLIQFMSFSANQKRSVQTLFT